jgi:hypothetical protein
VLLKRKVPFSRPSPPNKRESLPNQILVDSMRPCIVFSGFSFKFLLIPILAEIVVSRKRRGNSEGLYHAETLVNALLGPRWLRYPSPNACGRPRRQARAAVDILVMDLLRVCERQHAGARLPYIRAIDPVHTGRAAILPMLKRMRIWLVPVVPASRIRIRTPLVMTSESAPTVPPTGER